MTPTTLNIYCDSLKINTDNPELEEVDGFNDLYRLTFDQPIINDERISKEKKEFFIAMSSKEFGFLNCEQLRLTYVKCPRNMIYDEEHNMGVGLVRVIICYTKWYSKTPQIRDIYVNYQKTRGWNPESNYDIQPLIEYYSIHTTPDT